MKSLNCLWIVMKISSCDEIEERMKREHEKQLKNCNGCQPFVIEVVGTSSQSLQAFILMLMEFSIWNIQWLAKNTWWFVQKGLYGINTQWDRQSPEVSALITEVSK
ncbi:hypothetical protein Avbf_01196 [Armadillidium vulgare]|nr:hypothetical protein Avbf_13491 [Armadillidium vulgare]RXG70057.1 hypothetical protein Avbf_01196 [Armadillidium vulgare]